MASRGEYSGATWYGASPDNYTGANRPYSVRINKIVIHLAQGSWSGTRNWFKNSNAQISAHYTVSSRRGYVGQSVREKNIAWHAGWWRYNQTSIGIEHEGYVSNPDYYTDAMYRSSAKLSAYLSRKYGIPVDRYHIIWHNQVPGCSGSGGGVGCHTDPGRYWDWAKYLNLVRYYR